MIDFIMILGGLILLFVGGEGLVRGSVSLAKSYGLSNLLVSAVIVGFGTSMPEMTVSIKAALSGSTDIVLGNVVGSNIANILLIVGLAACIAPILINDSSVRRDVAMMLFTTALLCILAVVAGTINLFSGIPMLCLLLAHIAWSYRSDKIKQANINIVDSSLEETQEKCLSIPAALAFSLCGIGLLIGGASLLIEGAVSLARDFGISEAIIGLTIVAIGTSLPELATAVVAALKKQADVIIGNILGSNIFNILSILGFTSLIKTIPIPEQIINFDIWFMLFITLGLSAFLWMGLKINRGIGFTMLGIYVVYIAWLYTSGSI